MRTRESFGFKFFIRKERAAAGKCPVYLRITANGTSVSMRTRGIVESSNWNQKAQGLVPGSAEEIEINQMIKELSREIYQVVNRLHYEKKPISAQAIKMRISADSADHGLWKLFDYHLAHEGKLIIEATRRGYATTRKYLEKFLALRQLNDILLDGVDFKFITDFNIHLRQNPLNRRLNCKNNTAMKHLDRLKKLMGLALRLEWIRKDPFEFHKRHFTKTDREALNQSELESFQNVELKIQSQILARHLFIFACYTGLSFSEIDRLSKNHLSYDEEGNYWIEMSRKKLTGVTERKFHVLILPIAKEILEFYAQHPKAKRRGTVFPGMTNSAVNKQIHIISSKIGINKKVTFHVGRHTFATTVTLAKGVSMETVSHMLGHASIKTTEIYAKMGRNRIAEEMKGLKRQAI